MQCLVCYASVEVRLISSEVVRVPCESMKESLGVLANSPRPGLCAEQGYAVAAQLADDEEASSLIVGQKQQHLGK